jgi:hypothetical protein
MNRGKATVRDLTTVSSTDAVASKRLSGFLLSCHLQIPTDSLQTFTASSDTFPLSASQM